MFRPIFYKIIARVLGSSTRFCNPEMALHVLNLAAVLLVCEGWLTCVLTVSGWCLHSLYPEDVWMVCLNGFKLGKVQSGQGNPGHVKWGQVKSVQVMFEEVYSEQSTLGQIKLGQVKLERSTSDRSSQEYLGGKKSFGHKFC